MNLKIMTALLVVAVGCLFTAPVQAHPDKGCDSCHVPHNGFGDNKDVPLWNPAHTTTTLTGNYQSTDTTQATLGAPDGASKLCLSCHDGSYPRIATTHNTEFGPDPEDAMGALENTHPISFVFDTALATADGELVDPTTLPADVLDSNSKMQCTSCHDIHATAGRQDEGNLRWPYADGYGVTSAFCRHCHLK